MLINALLFYQKKTTKEFLSLITWHVAFVLDMTSSLEIYLWLEVCHQSGEQKKNLPRNDSILYQLIPFLLCFSFDNYFFFYITGNFIFLFLDLTLKKKKLLLLIIAHTLHSISHKLKAISHISKELFLIHSRKLIFFLFSTNLNFKRPTTAELI